MEDKNSVPRLLILFIATAQGLALYGMQQAFKYDSWISEAPIWSLTLMTSIILVPLFLMLSLNQGNRSKSVFLSLAFGTVLALLAAYTGAQAEPLDNFPTDQLIIAFIFSISIAAFKGLMYVQQRAAGQPMSYQVLFTYSWRNFLTMALSCGFVLAFFLVLLLWGKLFEVINIDFFSDLFEQEYFYFPVLGFAFGLGIIIFRDLTSVIDNITHLLQGLIKLLLPLLVTISVIFLCTLPFTGLDALWGTRNGTSILLWLTAILLFFTNAVYQDGKNSHPYPNTVHRLIYLGLLSLPILSAISFYGLNLRLEQYGWTLERSWGFIVWLILALFSIGYTWGIIKLKSDWTHMLGRVNTGMGLVVLALMLLINSPLLDLRKISLDSQLARVESGDILLKDFDFYYVHQNLARPGYLALEEMKTRIGESDPVLYDLINNPSYKNNRSQVQNTQKFWNRVVYRPSTLKLSDDLKSAIDTHPLARNPQQSVIIEVDIDNNGKSEYALIGKTSWGGFYAVYFYKDKTSWLHTKLHVSSDIKTDNIEISDITTGVVSREKPILDNLKIGDLLFQPSL